MTDEIIIEEPTNPQVLPKASKFKNNTKEELIPMLEEKEAVIEDQVNSLIEKEITIMTKENELNQINLIKQQWYDKQNQQSNELQDLKKALKHEYERANRLEEQLQRKREELSIAHSRYIELKSKQ